MVFYGVIGKLDFLEGCFWEALPKSEILRKGDFFYFKTYLQIVVTLYKILSNFIGL